MVRKAEPGNDVQLNIDIDAQKVAEDSLAQGIDGARHLIDPDHGRYYAASGGAVAVLDARTGAVMALSSAPTFDPNAIVMGGAPASYFDPNGELPLIDRALSPYAPGSTFKLFSAMATLKYGIRARGRVVLRRRLHQVRQRRAAVQRAEDQVRVRRPAPRTHRLE